MLAVLKSLPQIGFANFKSLTKFYLSLMNAGVVLYGNLLFSPLSFSPSLLFLFSGNLLMAMSTQAKGQFLEKEED